MAKARDAEQSVAAVGDDCSPLSVFFAKRCPKAQSQPHWKLQFSQYPDWVLSGAMEGRYLGKGKKDVVEVWRKRRSNGRQKGRRALRKAASMRGVCISST